MTLSRKPYDFSMRCSSTATLTLGAGIPIQVTMTDTSRELLRIALSCAVPLHAADLVTVPLSDLVAQAPAMGQYLAEHGDRLMFRSKRGETAEAFATCAKALAILSFFPGGVTFLGDHYEHKHPDAP
jgi:hypothetical protein